MKNIILLGFDAAGNVLTPKCSRSMTEAEILEGFSGVENIVGIDYADLSVMRKPVRLVNGEVTEALPPTAAELEAIEIGRLIDFAEETALKHGADILDPITNQPSADKNADINEIRKATGKARVNLVYLKKRGDSNGKAKANKAQAVEENLSVETEETILAIKAKTVKTEAEIISRIQAVVITY